MVVVKRSWKIDLRNPSKISPPSCGIFQLRGFNPSFRRSLNPLGNLTSSFEEGLRMYRLREEGWVWGMVIREDRMFRSEIYIEKKRVNWFEMVGREEAETV